VLLGVFGCKVDTSDDRSIGTGAISAEDFDAVEESALGDAEMGTTNRTSAVGTVWEKYGSSDRVHVWKPRQGRHGGFGNTK